MKILFLVLLSVAAADLKHHDNFVENSSFETDVNRDGYPDGWRAMAYESPAQMAWDADVAKSGSYSARVSDTLPLGNVDTKDWKTCSGRWSTRGRPIQPGQEYELEVWIKTQGVTGNANAHLAWQRGTHWLEEIATEGVSGTHDWQRVSVKGTAPENADSVVVSLNLSRSEGVAWFDDVRVAGMSDELPEITYVFHDTKNWFPFPFSSSDTKLDESDLTAYVDAPARNHGFVTVKPDGHFYFEDGTRARFFGTNVGGRSCAPDKQLARATAARLAKYGCNMLRLHSMDGRSNPLIDYSKGTSQQFNAEGLDRIDYFIAQLKERGIYVYMDLLDYRQFLTADGVAHGDEFTHNWAGSMKGASIFDERMIELQKDYATKLLTHRNPYTGLRYVDDPSVAVIETTNENSLFYFVRQADLSLPYYRENLTQRWNQWLAKRYVARAALDRKWTDARGRSALEQNEDLQSSTVSFPFNSLGKLADQDADSRFAPQSAPLRVQDALRFLAELQTHYYTTMRAHLKEIGVRVPIAGTNQMFLGVDAHIEAEQNDFISRNQYWRHPHRTAKPFWKFSNEPMLNVDIPSQRTPLAVIARTSVAGKPQAVAEYNFPWPNEYRAEGLLMSVAYSCLQDWDIFLLFSYQPDDANLTMFRSQSDPTRWGEFPAAALMFHRHDVATAENEVHVVQNREDRFLPRPLTNDADYTCQRFLTFISKVRSAFVDEQYRGAANVALCSGPSAEVAVAAPTRAIRFQERTWQKWLYGEFVAAGRELGLAGYDAIPIGQKRFVSDTGQLVLDYGDGLFIINSPCTKSAIGFLPKAGALKLDGLQLDCATPFAAITATSLDGQPIGDARRVLVTAVARAENTAQGFWPPEPGQPKWSTVNWMLPAEGRLPVITEPVHADITLAVPDRVTIYPLDPTGKRLAPLTVRMEKNAVHFNPAEGASIWFEVTTQ